MGDIATDGDHQPMQPSFLAPDRQRIEQRLRGVFVPPVTRIEHRAINFFSQQVYRTRTSMTHDQKVRVHSVKRQGSVDQRLALLQARLAHGHVHYIRTQPFAGQFETRLCAGRGFEEHVDLCHARKHVGVFLCRAVERDIFLGEVEYCRDLGRMQRFYAQKVTLRECHASPCRSLRVRYRNRAARRQGRFTLRTPGSSVARMSVWSDWQDNFERARAALAWQVEMGVDEAICDTPQNRYELAARSEPRVAAPAAQVPVAQQGAPESIDPVTEARHSALAARDLAELRAALAAYPHCELRQGARNLVFSDGQENARVMIVGEAPGREEDLQGKPFVGEAGQLLDRMFAAISMGRTHPDPARALYITNILPWRPPQNRDPSAAERAMMRPFVQRHIELIAPDIVVLMGRISASTLLETSDGITRLRGQWREVMGRPAIPMLHPAYLLRTPEAKREAWADLLNLQAKLREMT